MRALFTLLLAFAPALYAWWGGRRLAARLHDPALPERYLGYRLRVVQVAAVALAVMLVLLRPHWVWATPVMFLATQAAGFPARRAILAERWGLRAYLRHVLRITAAGLGFWLLLAFTPALIPDLGPMRWPFALVLAIALFAWQARYPEAFLALTRATPLHRPDLAPRLGAIAARSRVALPRLRRIGAPGGRWANAFALPSLGASTVVFTDTLLEELSPDETAAIFAHELAHLEHHGRRALILGRVVVGLAILAATVGIPVARTALGLDGSRLDWMWALVVTLALAIYGTHQRGHEGESDKRALALAGDAEALVRALVKLHALARLPRRYDPDVERGATHPSLARRVQAIRAAAGLTPAGLEGPVVVRSTEPGRRVVLEPDRIHWLDGIPAGVPDEATSLRERAAHVLSVPYRQLLELRLRAPLAGAPRLVASDLAGAHWALPVDAADVDATQEALDRVEGQLATPPSGWAHHPALAGLLSTSAVLAALVAGQYGAVLVPGVIGMFRASQGTLAALGATSVATGLLAARADEATLVTAAATPAALAALVVFGVVAMAAAVRRARTVAERRTRAGAVTAAALAVVAAVAWSGLLVAALGSARALRLHQAALARPAAAVALLGVAAALALGRRRLGHLAAVLCALLAVFPVVAGSRWFLLRFARDPFLAHPAGLTERAADARPVRETRLGTPAAQLRLSPSRSRFAVRPLEAGASEDEVVPSARLSVRSFSGPERELDAVDARFLNDLRVLALARVPPALELRAVSLDDAQDVSWRQGLPEVRAPRLELDTGLGLWRVIGTDPDARAAIVLSGRLNEFGFEEHRWPLLDARSGGGALPPLVSTQGALAIRLDVDRAAWALLPFAAGPALPVRSELWALGREGPRLIGASGLDLRCAEPPIDHADATFICAAYDGQRTLLWSVDARSGGLSAIGVVGARLYALQSAGQGRLIGWGEEGLVWIDPERREMTRLRLPADAERPTELVPAADAFGALAGASDGAVVTVYEIDPE
jgi:Zn-dependent protease with chaperone function